MQMRLIDFTFRFMIIRTGLFYFVFLFHSFLSNSIYNTFVFCRLFSKLELFLYKQMNSQMGTPLGHIWDSQHETETRSERT